MEQKLWGLSWPQNSRGRSPEGEVEIRYPVAFGLMSSVTGLKPS